MLRSMAAASVPAGRGAGIQREQFSCAEPRAHFRRTEPAINLASQKVPLHYAFIPAK